MEIPPDANRKGVCPEIFAGTEAIHEFTELKSVFVDYSGRLQKAQIAE